MLDDTYELLDAGDGRRLERFGERVVDRPAPAATLPRRDTRSWRDADLRFDRAGGWQAATGQPEAWPVELDGLRIELRPTAAGQVGVFPEQRPTWSWLRERVASRIGAGPPPRVLNLFAYTGLATLAAAEAGAAVTHVDASRPSVAWARHNAALSGLTDRPVRWIVDDVEAYVARERRRGVRYAGVVLDPPTYGHGRQAWRLADRLPALLEACAALLDERPFVALSAHTAGLVPDELAAALATAVRAPAGDVEAGPLELVAVSGARLPLGAFARWSR